MKNEQNGILYIVATPIGNLGDTPQQRSIKPRVKIPATADYF